MAKSPQRIPLYTQIREYILDHIKQNIWRPNDRLPSENELSAQFGVSRITVKNALSELIEGGLIFRVQGKGSFVSPNRDGEPLVYKPEADIKEKQLIAFLMPRLDNTHTTNILNGIESEISKRGFRMIFCKTFDSQEIERETLRDVIQLGVKGIIIFPVEGETYSEEILRLSMNHFPLVVVDRYLRGIETNCVCADNHAGAYDATTHLIHLGHTKIGFISTNYQGTTSIEDRLAGYEKGLAEYNIPIDHRLRMTHFNAEQINYILHEGTSDESIKNEIQSLIRNNPEMTAIFALNSVVGMNIIESAFEIGVRVPEDLSVISFDNYLSPLSIVPMTCISQEEKQLGKESAKLLISIMDNPKQERRKIMMPTKLIIRKSTAPCPVKLPNSRSIF